MQSWRGGIQHLPYATHFAHLNNIIDNTCAENRDKQFCFSTLQIKEEKLHNKKGIQAIIQHT